MRGEERKAQNSANVALSYYRLPPVSSTSTAGAPSSPRQRGSCRAEVEVWESVATARHLPPLQDRRPSSLAASSITLSLQYDA